MCTGFEALPILFEGAEGLAAVEGIGAIEAAEGIATGAVWEGIEAGELGMAGGVGGTVGELETFAGEQFLPQDGGWGGPPTAPMTPFNGEQFLPSDGSWGGPSTEALAQGGFSSFGSGGFGDVSGLGGFGTPAPASGFDWSGAMKYAGPAMSVLSGLQGQQQARAMRKAATRADPWGTSGGRAAASAQLQDLMSNPMAAAGRDPSYALRIQGAQRANAMYGQDSGAMAVAGANASTDWYNARLAQLGSLAGVGNASAGQSNGPAAADLYGSGLASIGYGITRATGGGTTAELAAQGRGGDTMLAHINPAEAALLQRAGGSGRINPNTGLREYNNDPEGNVNAERSEGTTPGWSGGEFSGAVKPGESLMAYAESQAPRTGNVPGERASDLNWGASGKNYNFDWGDAARSSLLSLARGNVPGAIGQGAIGGWGGLSAVADLLAGLFGESGGASYGGFNFGERGADEQGFMLRRSAGARGR